MTFPAVDSIETPRLRLVPVADEHLDDLLAVNGDDEVTRFVPYRTWTSREDGAAWLSRINSLTATGTARQFVLKRKDDDRAIGTLLLFKYDQGSRRIELGYALGRAAWHQGYMQEAVAGACGHAFSVLGVRRIEAEVNPDNAASCRLLSRLGFRLEGRFRQRWTAKGLTYDTNMYGLLVQDWHESGRAA